MSLLNKPPLSYRDFQLLLRWNCASTVRLQSLRAGSSHHSKPSVILYCRATVHSKLHVKVQLSQTSHFHPQDSCKILKLLYLKLKLYLKLPFSVISNMQANVILCVCVTILFFLNACLMILPVPRKKRIGQGESIHCSCWKNSFRKFGLVWLEGRWSPNDWDSVLAWKQPTLWSRALASSKHNWFCYDYVWALWNCGLGRCFNLRIKHNKQGTMRKASCMTIACWNLWARALKLPWFYHGLGTQGCCWGTAVL